MSRSDVLLLVGAVLVVGGAGMIYLPLAPILAGVAALAAGYVLGYSERPDPKVGG